MLFSSALIILVVIIIVLVVLVENANLNVGSQNG